VRQGVGVAERLGQRFQKLVVRFSQLGAQMIEHRLIVQSKWALGARRAALQ